MSISITRKNIYLVLIGILALTAGIVFAATVSISSSPNVAIPDGTVGFCPGTYGAPATDTINVGSSGTISNVTVELNVSHSYVSDLAISLTSPRGTTVSLVNHIGGGNTCGCPFGDLNVTLDSSVVASIDDACGNQASGTTFAPSGPLGAFNAQEARGTWTLSVRDRNSSNTGTLISWTLTITTSEGEFFGFSDGRINRYDAAAPVIVYAYTAGGIDIYSPDGVQLLRVNGRSMSLAECDEIGRAHV